MLIICRVCICEFSYLLESTGSLKWIFLVLPQPLSDVCRGAECDVQVPTWDPTRPYPLFPSVLIRQTSILSAVLKAVPCSSHITLLMISPLETAPSIALKCWVVPWAPKGWHLSHGKNTCVRWAWFRLESSCFAQAVSSLLVNQWYYINLYF